MALPVLNVLRTSRLSIATQLHLEEAILRGTKQNWLIINDGAFIPAIVMGISGKPNELVNVPAAHAKGVQVLKRFTGGGTVVVDDNTLFASLIFDGACLPNLDCYPQPIMKWTENFYQHAFGRYGDFRLRENDYVFNERKFGGNAQAITGKRWLHHTSFLWDYSPAYMALLKHPPKAPQYRQGRPHDDFLVRLCEHVASRQELLLHMLNAAYQLPGFVVQERSMADVEALMAEARSSILTGTKVINLAQHLEPTAVQG